MHTAEHSVSVLPSVMSRFMLHSYTGVTLQLWHSSFPSRHPAYFLSFPDGCDGCQRQRRPGSSMQYNEGAPGRPQDSSSALPHSAEQEEQDADRCWSELRRFNQTTAGSKDCCERKAIYICMYIVPGTNVYTYTYAAVFCLALGTLVQIHR